MQRVLTFLLALLLLPFNLVLSQEGRQPQAILSRRLITRGEMYHPLSEAYLDLEEHASKPGGVAAFRICSKEPLPLAIFLAVLNPVNVADGFTSGAYGKSLPLSSDRIMLLRSPDCSASDSQFTPLEIWAVPNGAALPSSVESANLSQVRLESVRPQGAIKSAKGYRAAVQALTAKLRAEPEAVGVVIGSYYDRLSPAMEKNLCVARKILEQSGLSADRLYVHATPSSIERRSGESEPKYPSLFVVEVAKTKDSARR